MYCKHLQLLPDHFLDSCMYLLIGFLYLHIYEKNTELNLGQISILILHFGNPYKMLDLQLLINHYLVHSQ